ncbi:DUF4936 family protein [Rubrivivax gelatinosus]|uniref:DUF4936 family protein n=1 Tax=Rubrivivax gelatinosus TaxID=28068 RepID=UPI0032119A9A
MPQPVRRYVYYRVAEDQVGGCSAAVLALFRQLRTEYAGASFELLRRPEARDGLATLMEVHAGLADEAAADAVEARLAAALQPWIAGPRHVERFLPLG